MNDKDVFRKNPYRKYVIYKMYQMLNPDMTPDQFEKLCNPFPRTKIDWVEYEKKWLELYELSNENDGQESKK